MFRFALYFYLFFTACSLFAQPTITPTYFLNTDEPERMCQNYIDTVYADSVRLFTQPFGGALARIDMGDKDLCLYFFCDKALNKLIIFYLEDYGPMHMPPRVPVKVKSYGIFNQPPWYEIVHVDSIAPETISPPYDGHDTVGCFFRPVDVTVSSQGRHFDPSSDFVYVLDQANLRVVKLSYDINNDTLIWEDSFGRGIFEFPTAIDYADYQDTASSNDDIYVTDGMLSRVFRFSASGVFEESYGGYGSNMALMKYPSGIAISTSAQYPNRFYVSDSKNHRVVRYYSESTGQISAERQYIFPHFLPSPVFIPHIIGLDTDYQGNLYVLNSFTHNITVLSANLDSVILEYGSYGSQPGQFQYPTDIYIDWHDEFQEMQICEFWGGSSGIQSFQITPGLGKRAVAETLPTKFFLYQNYPNPFNTHTIIRFDLPSPGNVRLEIFNILGQKVTILVDAGLSAGNHNFTWNGRNSDGKNISTGIYFYRIQNGENVSIRKMLLLK